MSTTEQRTADTGAGPAGGSGWAVPGLDHLGRGAGSSDCTGRPLDPAMLPGAGEVGSRRGAELSAAEDGERVDVAGVLRGAGAGGSAPGGPGGPAHPLLVAVLACLEALQGVRGVSASTLTPREIRVLLLAVVQVGAAVFALRLRLLVAGEVQRVQDLTGASTVAAFFAHLTQTRLGDARAQARLARDLDRRYPLLLDALEQGLVSPEQVQVAVAALRRLPRRQVGPDRLVACQRFLVDAAGQLAPDQLRVVGKKLWQVIDPAGAERRDGAALEDEEKLARAKAYFRSWRHGDGTTGFRGKLPDLQADMLLKALQAFAAPRRRKNPNIPTGQPDDIRHPDPHPAPGSRPGDEEQDVPYPVRLGHALIELIERYPTERLPYAGGIAATVVATMTLDQLLGGPGVATLDTGTPISAGQARRLACEAGIIPLVLGGDSQPLDVGREQRYHTKYQRLAISVVDKNCAVHGCGRPATDCHYHHPTPFSEGGATSVTNGAPVCPHHHGLIHSGQWTVTWHNRKAKLTKLKR